MKYLQRLISLLVISAAIFSCQKEYSVENNTGIAGNSAQWSFNEGSAQFKGPIDTVYIDTLPVGNLKILTINGHSSDNKEEITLNIEGTSLQAGSYKTPNCLFAYMRNGVILYQSNPTLADSFTIVITKLDSTGITGTFRGKAFDTAKVSKNIVDGKFAAVFKTKATTTPPVSADSGNVVLWSKVGCGGGTSTSPITVSVAGKSGQITKFGNEPATCDPAGSYFLKLPVGNYTWVAKCGTDSTGGSLTVTKSGCTKQQVDLTVPVVTGDYFPMTANSNWSYLYDGGSPGDTLYTFSTGSTKTFAGKVYNLFTNYDGISKDSSYYRKAGNTYYEYIPASVNTDSSTGLTISLPAFEYSFLVDNLAANAVFSNGPFVGTASLGGNTLPLSASNKSTVLATGATVTVGSISYTNVIKIKTVYSYTFAGTPTDIYAVEQWFAKGVGLIKYFDYGTTPFTSPDDILNLTRAKVY